MSRRSMRWMVNIIAVLMLLGLIGGLSLHNRATVRDRDRISRTRESIRAIERAVRYRSVTKAEGLNSEGWPETIDPSWFEIDQKITEPPLNSMLAGANPWLEIAPPDQSLLEHPPVRMAVDGSYAGFWYNPANGIIRARVPVLVSDSEATELYNLLNGTALQSIFEEEKIDQRLVRAIEERRSAAASHREADGLDPSPEPNTSPQKAVSNPESRH